MTIPSTQEIFFNSEKGPQKNNVDYFIVKFRPLSIRQKHDADLHWAGKQRFPAQCKVTF